MKILKIFLALTMLVGTAIAVDSAQNTQKLIKEKKAERIRPPEGARCPVCGMLIGKNSQWATMIKTSKEELYFDGVKDMMKYYFEKGKKDDQIYVSDYYKLNKIDARTAYYVTGSNVLGPMGNELIPFANEEDAKTFAKDHGGKQIVKFDEITTLLVERLM